MPIDRRAQVFAASGLDYPGRCQQEKVKGLEAREKRLDSHYFFLRFYGVEGVMFRDQCGRASACIVSG